MPIPGPSCEGVMPVFHAMQSLVAQRWVFRARLCGPFAWLDMCGLSREHAAAYEDDDAARR